jgi:hypothetical protein
MPGLFSPGHKCRGVLEPLEATHRINSTSLTQTASGALPVTLPEAD